MTIQLTILTIVIVQILIKIIARIIIEKLQLLRLLQQLQLHAVVVVAAHVVQKIVTIIIAIK